MSDTPPPPPPAAAAAAADTAPPGALNGVVLACRAFTASGMYGSGPRDPKIQLDRRGTGGVGRAARDADVAARWSRRARDDGDNDDADDGDDKDDDTGDAASLGGRRSGLGPSWCSTSLSSSCCSSRTSSNPCDLAATLDDSSAAMARGCTSVAKLCKMPSKTSSRVGAQFTTVATWATRADTGAEGHLVVVKNNLNCGCTVTMLPKMATRSGGLRAAAPAAAHDESASRLRNIFMPTDSSAYASNGTRPTPKCINRNSSGCNASTSSTSSTTTQSPATTAALRECSHVDVDDVDDAGSDARGAVGRCSATDTNALMRWLSCQDNSLRDPARAASRAAARRCSHILASLPPSSSDSKAATMRPRWASDGANDASQGTRRRVGGSPCSAGASIKPPTHWPGAAPRARGDVGADDGADELYGGGFTVMVGPAVDSSEPVDTARMNGGCKGAAPPPPPPPPPPLAPPVSSLDRVRRRDEPR